MVSAQIQESNGIQTYCHLENDHLKAEIFLPRGGEMIGLTDKKTGAQVIRQVDGFRDVYDRIIRDKPRYYDDYMNEWTTGGWFEMFPHASRTIDNDPSGYCVHGDLRFAACTAEILHSSKREAAVKVIAQGFKIDLVHIRIYTIKDNDRMVRVIEKVINKTGSDLPIIWGHHPTFGTPFIDDCEVEIPAKNIYCEADMLPNAFPMWNGQDIRKTMPAQQEAGHRMLFLTEFDTGRYTIRNAKLGVALRVEWDPKTFPVVWYWNSRGGNGKLHDSFALEFVTGFPYNLKPERFVLRKQQDAFYAFGFAA